MESFEWGFKRDYWNLYDLFGCNHVFYKLYEVPFYKTTSVSKELMNYKAHDYRCTLAEGNNTVVVWNLHCPYCLYDLPIPEVLKATLPFELD